MDNNECYITTLGEEWERIGDCNVHMNVKRRLQRTVIRGNEGDDLLDEGAESAVYTITGKMEMDQYKSILFIFGYSFESINARSFGRKLSKQM